MSKENQKENILKELVSIRNSIRSDLDKLDHLIIEVSKVLGVSPIQEQEDLFCQVLYDLCFEPDEHNTYLPQTEMYSYLKMNIMKSEEFLNLCKSYGWSEKTANNPLWRRFTSWLINKGHERTFFEELNTRIIKGVKKKTYPDFGRSKIESILASIPPRDKTPI